MHDLQVLRDPRQIKAFVSEVRRKSPFTNET